MVHGTAYDVPRSVGKFDAVTLCAILLHLLDPIRALEHAVEFTENAIIISDLVPFHLTAEEQKRPLAVFLPANRFTPHGGVTWWHMSPVIYRNYLEVRGFDVSEPTFGTFRHQAGPRAMYQLIARRRQS
ncbi:MAG: hypothetical protein ACREX4_25280 [Gammaproteobacteria bacterium]